MNTRLKTKKGQSLKDASEKCMAQETAVGCSSKLLTVDDLDENNKIGKRNLFFIVISTMKANPYIHIHHVLFFRKISCLRKSWQCAS